MLFGKFCLQITSRVVLTPVTFAKASRGLSAIIIPWLSSLVCVGACKKHFDSTLGDVLKYNLFGRKMTKKLVQTARVTDDALVAMRQSVDSVV